MLGWEKEKSFRLATDCSAYSIDLLNVAYLARFYLDSINRPFRNRHNLDSIPHCSEGAGLHIGIGAGVVDVYERPDKFIPGNFLPLFNLFINLFILGGIA